MCYGGCEHKDHWHGVTDALPTALTYRYNSCEIYSSSCFTKTM